MNSTLTRKITSALFVLGCSGAWSWGALDVTYTSATPNSEILTGGSLRLRETGSDGIHGTFTRGGTDSTTFNHNLVIFIDSMSGGSANNVTWSGNGSELMRAASGINATGSTRSTAQFHGIPGQTPFLADYVIALGVYRNGAIFRLNQDGALEQTLTFTLTPNDSQVSRQFDFNVSWSALGVTDTENRGLRFYTSYVNSTGSRYLQSLETISGSAGFGNTITFDNYHLFGMEPIPEMTNVALAVFGGLAGVWSLLPRARRWLKPAGRGQ